MIAVAERNWKRRWEKPPGRTSVVPEKAQTEPPNKRVAEE